MRRRFAPKRCIVAAEALQPIDTATTVRVRHGRLSVTDGPFAETKEQLAGFYLIEARDLNEAIQMAAKIPPAREGSVEVRPVRELNPEPSVLRSAQTNGVCLFERADHRAACLAGRQSRSDR